MYRLGPLSDPSARIARRGSIHESASRSRRPLSLLGLAREWSDDPPISAYIRSRRDGVWGSMWVWEDLEIIFRSSSTGYIQPSFSSRSAMKRPLLGAFFVAEWAGLRSLWVRRSGQGPRKPSPQAIISPAPPTGSQTAGRIQTKMITLSNPLPLKERENVSSGRKRMCRMSLQPRPQRLDHPSRPASHPRLCRCAATARSAPRKERPRRRPSLRSRACCV